jgi:hypothetical protein
MVEWDGKKATNGEQIIVCKEEPVAHFKALSRHSFGNSEEGYGNRNNYKVLESSLQDGRELTTKTLRYEKSLTYPRADICPFLPLHALTQCCKTKHRPND